MPINSPEERTAWIKEKAAEYGFMGVGVAQAASLDKEAQRLKTWLDKGYHGTMGYMENPVSYTHLTLPTTPYV